MLQDKFFIKKDFIHKNKRFSCETVKTLLLYNSGVKKLLQKGEENNGKENEAKESCISRIEERNKKLFEKNIKKKEGESNATNRKKRRARINW